MPSLFDTPPDWRRRRAGILLHPTSLPGPHAIGDLGPVARRWLDFLTAAGARLWQVLPLGPVGFGHSPYAALSAFAGNPLLISLEDLVTDGWLAPHELAELPDLSEGPADYARAYALKEPLLTRAHERFRQAGGHPDYAAFCAQEAPWLEDWALFAALREQFGGQAWTSWDPALVHRDPTALTHWQERLAPRRDYHRFVQWLFFRQWRALRQRANARGIALIGDLPIFVSHDSADVWTHPDFFALDQHGQPTVVAGVPPDYFSATGQRWGNPLYRWEVLAASGYAWWVARVRHALSWFDLVRLDHFRGFVATWEIPARETTAVNGRWVPGPGRALFDALQAALGPLPILVEDLGIITPDVEALRDELGLPGMKVLQFAFGSGPANPYLPYQYPQRCVVYTGTHDNDTTVGWYAHASEPERDAARRYLAVPGHDIAWDFIRLALASVAIFALAPLQDLLALGSEGRLNVPGASAGNWVWRVSEQALAPGIAARFRELCQVYGRLGEDPAQRAAEQE
ncbi:MAG: 4-alpha-glucanotransferase [Dehalococcoidia bacterium]|nr:MAG: 4-alpha-glucanotransferase [Dehalococcoidia bacterium]